MTDEFYQFTIYFYSEMVWILTRDQNPDLAILQQAYTVMDKNRISKAYLLRTDQYNCNTGNVSYTLTDERT